MAEEVTADELIRHLRGIRRIVINTCHGGFGLSKAGEIEYLKRAGIPYTTEPQEDRDKQNRLGDRIMVDGKEFWGKYDIPRDDPALVAAVRHLGSAANGDHAKLKIVEIPADVEWQIDSYDGKEWVAEQHRTWR